MSKSKTNKQSLNSKKNRENRSKKVKYATYFGSVAGLLVIGIIGVVVWLVGRTPNYPAYRVNDAVVKKDVYNCAYYYGAIAADEKWASYGFDILENPYKQKFNNEFENGEKYDTWGDYFQHLTDENLKFMLIMSEMAKKQGYEYPDSVEQDIQKELDKVEAKREDKSVSFKTFMIENYGAEISESALKEYVSLNVKALDFCNHLMTHKELFKKLTSFTDADIERQYAAGADDYDSVSFRYYSLKNTQENEAKIKKLQNAGSEEDFKALCNAYSAENKEYAKKDKSLYKNQTLEAIRASREGNILSFFENKNAKKGETITVFNTYKGSEIAEVIFLVSPRGKNNTAYENSGVKTWEYQAMGELLEEYYKKNFDVGEVAEGIDAFKNEIVAVNDYTAAASSKATKK